ncbi:competence protein [Sedimentitalea sp. CY04]|uniref:Competence protein n=1 Tax=Parasedimentitalea denitrificans TaxID=2211118 RepID=A0ABX0W7N1_9RHOB|nr:ComEC/Rec2 family competence protein [Sedimentitalea sp. CY04]NIZ60784.1 competence protein [Sedimentitalea sp. CY04]
MRATAALDSLLLSQRGHLFPWAPVFLGTGVRAYFALMTEPDIKVYAALVCVGSIGGLVGLRAHENTAVLGWAVMLVAAGFCLSGYRANHVAAAVLPYRYYGPIEGRIVAIDRSASDAVRLTLDRVRLRDMPREQTPERLRVSLHGPTDVPVPGSQILTTGYLMPPQGPAEPGGFDFRRHAWFQRIGAVGYTRMPVLLADPSGGDLWLQRLRLQASAYIQARLPGETGGFAAALTTGDRSGISQDSLAALRGSNLAHLLAISGLHMGLLSGFVFACLRFILCLWPRIALRVVVKKVAAVGALIVAAGYLALSGGNVATERAFIMVAVVLGAVLLDRRAFSLRAVGLAAMIVLIHRPESLLSPGFQMSFAATTALVAVFSWTRDSGISLGPSWLRGATAVVISSAVAGAATAPFGAAHFNTLSHYGLIANLASVPLMGVLVIPAAVLALCLAPLGAEMIGLSLMSWGLDWILMVAHWVTSLDGAQGRVAAPEPVVLPLISLGALFVILWQGWLRTLGVVPVILAFVLWAQVERPAVLISADGALVGKMTDEGRALSKPKGAGFAARIWLENDGDGTDQAAAAGRWLGRAKIARIGTHEVIHVIGKRAVEAYDSCRDGEIIITTVNKDLTGGCLVFDPARLRDLGSLMITSEGVLVSARDLSGQRLWTGNGARDRRQP